MNFTCCRVIRALAGLIGLFYLPVAPVQAHFGMIIPSTATVMEAQEAKVSLLLKFWHPFENTGMNMEKPAAFTVLRDGATENLLPLLQESKEQGKKVWRAEYLVNKPGLFTFAMEPQPYFEPEEDCFIIHYTKVSVDAFGDAEGWDKPLGLKTEIVPLVRPGALYAGNVFQGKVLMDGNPVANAEVEVEWYPGPGRQGVAPNRSMITQTVKADEAGVFTYAPPAPGWWGFAALHEADFTLPFQGKQKHVELGGVLWAHFYTLPPSIPLKPASK